MTENQNKANSSPLQIIDVVRIFLNKKKQIFTATAVICVISIILYFFVFDLIYLSTASIKSSSKSGGLLGALDGGIPDVEGLDELGLGGSKSAKELAAYEEIINSRRLLEKVIIKFDLMNREKYDFMQDAVKEFREEKLTIKQEKLAGMMYIGVYDKDPLMAKEMVEYILLELDKINIELNVLNAKNNREFIEKRYFQAKEDLRKSEDSLQAFQLIYGIAPDLQIKAAATSAFTLEAELKAEEVKLDVLKKILSADQPEVKTQEAKVSSLRSKISEIQNSTDLSQFLKLGNSPQIAAVFLRLQRELEIQTKILTFMLPLYEQAKIEEKRETPTILILDYPVIAEKKTKPKRLTMVLVFTFLGCIFSTLFFVLKERIANFKMLLKSQ